MNSFSQISRRNFCLSAFPLLVGAQSKTGVALLAAVSGDGMIQSDGGEMARRFLLPPGSTLKPFVLLTLLENRRLTPNETYACQGRLQISGRRLNCSHPRLSEPVDVSRAIAYSCNCAVAHYVSRLDRRHLASAFAHWGLNRQTGLLSGPEATGLIQIRAEASALQLLALGEEGIQITPLELLRSYRTLARRAGEPVVAPVLSGLEGAVAFGTAQNARLNRVQVAGKTGTVRAPSGNFYGWFAGFAPSRSPEVVVTVLAPGRSGGADAAPIAAGMLRTYFGEKS